MKYRFTLLMILLNSVSGISAQSILDSEFSWVENDNCIQKGTCTEIFVKAEKDPIINQYSINEFEIFLKKLVHDLEIGTSQNGVLKLKILFGINQGLCFYKIGCQGIVLNEEQQIKLQSRLKMINETINGEQKNLSVICLGILYITISYGEMVQFRNVNFKLK